MARAAGGCAGTEGPRLRIQSGSPALGQVRWGKCQKPVLELPQVWGPAGDLAPAQAEGPPSLQGDNGTVLLGRHVSLEHMHFPYCGEETPNCIFPRLLLWLTEEVSAKAL